MSTTITYNGSTLLNIEDGSGATLTTSGKYVPNDIIITDTTDVSDALEAIEDKGVTVPSGSGRADLANLIAQIQQGAGSAISITDTLDAAGGTYRQINAVSLEGDTVSANTLLSGITAHNAFGEPITGTYSESSINYKYGVLRPDAQLVQSYSYDKKLIADEVIEEIPAYTTASTTLVASAALTPTVTLDYANYNYYVLERFLTIPEYSVTTKAKGRTEYSFLSQAYEIAEIPANRLATLVDGKQLASRSVTVSSAGVFQRLFYWSSGTAVAAYSTAAYGTVQGVVAPAVSSGVLTLNSPNFIIRGSTTYLTSTYFNAITDIRYQYKIEVYRVPKGNANLDGWGLTTQADHIIDCVLSDTHTLT